MSLTISDDLFRVVGGTSGLYGVVFFVEVRDGSKPISRK